MFYSAEEIIEEDNSFDKQEDSIRELPTFNYQPLICQLQQHKFLSPHELKKTSASMFNQPSTLRRFFFLSYLWGLRKFCESTLKTFTISIHEVFSVGT
jgi:hypothetical protein